MSSSWSFRAITLVGALTFRQPLPTAICDNASATIRTYQSVLVEYDYRCSDGTGGGVGQANIPRSKMVERNITGKQLQTLLENQK